MVRRMAIARASSFTERTAWARNVAAPVRDFLGTETGGAAVLLAATVAALVWANSPWSSSYESVWTTDLTIRIGHAGISEDLRVWINDGLMTFFFLVVGLEAKRELQVGELRERSRLTVPVIASIGGMTVAIAAYLAFNAGGAGAGGWGATMSTDTAFALGILALAGPHRAARLRVFLLTMVVVDDLAGLAVITTAYTTSLSVVALAIALGLFGVLAALRYAPVGRNAAAAVVAVAIWVAMFESGIDPAVTGLVIGLVTSAYPASREDLEHAIELTRSFREQPTPELARSAQLGVASAISPNERLQYRLHPWTSFVIVPLFALANAGIHVTGGLLSDAIASPITLGIIFGYAVGKPVGILAASWLATRRVLGGPPLVVTWPGLAGTGAAAGVGFTVSVLIASLAFHGEHLEEAKLGILATAVIATALTWVAFRLVGMIPAGRRARQLLGTAEELLDLAEDVDPARDHIRGPQDAPVTFLEYGDYQCPYCGQAEQVIRDLLASFGDDVRYVWRHLPLNDVHPNAQMAAEAAEAAGSQGSFWDMHDMLLANQDALAAPDIRRYMDEVGIDADRAWDEIRRRVHAPRITEDVSSADASAVTGTPTFFINGRRHQGAYDLATLTEEVRRARQRAQLAMLV